MDKLAKREEKQSFWKLHKEELWSMVPYLWPKEQLWIKFMLICAIFSLLASKLCSVTSPIALKIAVDRVSENRTDIEWTIVAYGALRFGVSFFSELKDNSFVYVSAHASRKISLRVFTHVMNLSVRFHITRKTGAVIRGCARGSESFALLLKYISFQIAPIFIEVAMVCCFLLVQYDWYFGIITFFVIFAYIGFTVPFTESGGISFVASKRKRTIGLTKKATDSLLNFETIKLFCAEPHIAHTYDEALKQTQKATLKTTQSLAGLNLGQALIITVGITASMGLAAEQVVDGKMTIGDFVLVNTFILQLYVPLNF